MDDSVEKRVKEIIADYGGSDAEEVSRNTLLVEDLNIDSLDAVELVMAMEDAFAVSIPAAEVQKMRTVGDVVDHIEGEGGAGVFSRLKRPPGSPGKRAQ